MSGFQYWIVNALAAACLFALGSNIWLATANKSAQTDLALRQQYVQQSVQLEALYRDIIRALAELSARNNDADVKAMLARHGITYSLSPAAQAPAAAGRE